MMSDPNISKVLKREYEAKKRAKARERQYKKKVRASYKYEPTERTIKRLSRNRPHTYEIYPQTKEH